MGYWLVKAVLAPLLRLFFRPYVTGAENLPERGAAILAGNHTTFLDNFMIPLVVPRKVTFLAKSDYFTGKGPKGWLSAPVLLRRRHDPDRPVRRRRLRGGPAHRPARAAVAATCSRSTPRAPARRTAGSTAARPAWRAWRSRPASRSSPSA